MKSILENLNRSVGVVGSAVITSDGMVVTSAMSHAEKEEVLAAIGSSLVISAQKSLKDLGDFPQDPPSGTPSPVGTRGEDGSGRGAPLQLMTIDGSRGKIVIVNAGSIFLLVITDTRIALDQTMLDIGAAVRRLQKVVSLDA